MDCVTRLKKLRIEHCVTQKDISDYLHIKQNTYSQYENGKRGMPIETLIKLATYYGVSTDYILNLTDEDTPYPQI